MPNPTTKFNAKEAWLRRLGIYWTVKQGPHFITRIGEIYEVDFGINVGTEFSGRHLAICLRDSVPSQEKMLVIPLTTKIDSYNISDEDIIETNAKNVDGVIKAGIALGEARWISKIRTFQVSKILNEPEDTSCYVKGMVNVSKSDLKRWLTL